MRKNYIADTKSAQDNIGVILYIPKDELRLILDTF